METRTRSCVTRTARGRRSPRACAAGLLAAFATLGCGNTPGTMTTGGDGGQDASALDAAFDAGTGEASVDALPDNTAPDTAPSPDAADGTPLPSDCLADGGHGGSRWQDLYACYFGPTGTANCSLGSNCHGTGGAAAAIWECGATSALCYQGIMVSLVPDGGASDPTTTLLHFSLRKADGSGGSMPQIPADVTFGTRDLARIDGWVQSGASNN